LGRKTRKNSKRKGKKKLLLPPTWNLMLPSFLPNSKLAMLNVKSPTHYKKIKWGGVLI
jgi:hypothetical protein